MLAIFFLTRFLQYNYAPTTGPWYQGADWPNVFVLLILAPFGWAWAKAKLRLLHIKLDQVIAHHKWAAHLQAAEFHARTGKLAPTHPHYDLEHAEKRTPDTDRRIT